MSAEEWVGQFAEAIGAEAPSEEELEAVLALAAEAAHASARQAAPVACWLAGRAGMPLAEALEAAEGMAGETG